jgi:hypothetical protein
MSDVAKMPKQGLGDKAKKVPSIPVPDFVARMVALFDPIVRGRLFELGKRRQPTQKIIEQRRSANSSPRSRNRKSAKRRNRVSYSMKAWGFQRRRKPTIPHQSSTKFAVTSTDGGACATPINGR